MKTTSRALEIAQVKHAIAQTNARITQMEIALAQMRENQIARHREVARQEAFAQWDALPSACNTAFESLPENRRCEKCGGTTTQRVCGLCIASSPLRGSDPFSFGSVCKLAYGPHFKKS